MQRPILVTGSHRSGTTWVGRMLCLSREAGYIHEPFNPDRRPGWTRGRIPYWFLFVGPHNERSFEPVVRTVLDFRYPYVANLREVRGPRQAVLYGSDAARSVTYRGRRLRPLVKDPIALFSAGWIARTFGSDVVVMVRHPAAFVSSVRRLNWRFRFKGWIAQGELLEGPLAPFKEEIHHHWRNDVGLVDESILMWKAIHHVIDQYREQHPDWLFLRHEDLSADPIEGFARAYGTLGLTWGDRVAHAIAMHTGGDNPAEVAPWRRRSVRRHSASITAIWKQRLSDEEVRRVIAGTREIARRFYSDEELSVG